MHVRTHTHTLEMELLGAVSLYKSEEGVGGKKRELVIRIRCMCVSTGARIVGELF